MATDKQVEALAKYINYGRIKVEGFDFEGGGFSVAGAVMFLDPDAQGMLLSVARFLLDSGVLEKIARSPQGGTTDYRAVDAHNAAVDKLTGPQ